MTREEVRDALGRLQPIMLGGADLKLDGMTHEWYDEYVIKAEGKDLVLKNFLHSLHVKYGKTVMSEYSHKSLRGVRAVRKEGNRWEVRIESRSGAVDVFSLVPLDRRKSDNGRFNDDGEIVLGGRY